MTDRIHLSKADVSHVEEEFVLRALKSGWIAPLGPDVDAFENEVAERVGVAHALALSSGTAALHLALIHLGARPGTVVVLPSMTFAASANAIMYTGAEPVFVDSQAADGNIDPDLLIEAVDTLKAEGQHIAAVMTVDLFGHPCDYETIEGALGEREIPLLEDAAESLGASTGHRQAGSFGSAAGLSFNGNKIMTTSGGGMLLSNDGDLVAHARKLSTQAREEKPWYEHVELGYNYRLSNILAALGRGQLTRLDDMLLQRKENYNRYRRILGRGPGVRLLGNRPMNGGERTNPNFWLTSVVIDEALAGFSANQLGNWLTHQNVEVRPLWKPMHMQPLYNSRRMFGGSVSERLFETGLTLPSGSSLSSTQWEKIEDIIREFMARHKAPDCPAVHPLQTSDS